MDITGEEGQRAGHHPSPAQVIVVAADDDRLMGQRARAFEHADHILGVDRRPVDRDLGGKQDAFQQPRPRLQVVVDLFLQVSQARFARGRENLVGILAGKHDEGEIADHIRTAGTQAQNPVRITPQTGEVVDQQHDRRAVLKCVGGLVPEGRVVAGPLAGERTVLTFLLRLAANDQDRLASHVNIGVVVVVQP